MTPVWIVGDDQLEFTKEPLKVFKEEDDALNYYNSRHISEVSMVEAELVWVVPPTFPLPPSKYTCNQCNNPRPAWFDLCYNDNKSNVDKAWCDICQEDTEFK